MAKAIDRACEAALDELGAGDADIERGLRIHRDAIVCDPVSGGARPWSPAMSALARELIRNGTAPQDMELQLQEVADRDVVADAEVRSEYLEAWRRSGVTLANDYGHMFCSWRTEGFGGLVNDLMITLRSVARTTAVLDALRDHLIKFQRADDVVAAKRAGKHCIMWSTGGPPPWIEHDLGNLEVYHRLGFRQAQILYYTNRLGTQCYDRRDHGLTDAGVDYVRRLNGLGIVVDLAHCSRRTHLDAAAASLAPVIDSHTGCTAVRDHARNLDDETIRAIAGTGGVVSILGGPGRRFLAEPLGGLADWLRHVEHVAEVAGIEHVGGRGSDISYRGSIPEDIPAAPVRGRPGADGRPARRQLRLGRRAVLHRGAGDPRLHRRGDRSHRRRQLPARAAGGVRMIRLCTFASDITPPVGHPLCAGWYPPAQAIGERLQALGLILIADDGPPVVLCALDWAELSNGDYDRWRTDLAQAVGTEPDRVAVHCTHAHDTPWPDRDAQDILDAHGRPDIIMAGDWAERTRAAAAGAAAAAMAEPRPCTHFTTGEARVDRIASNRRLIGRDGTVWAMRLTRTRDPMVRAAPEGVIDPMLKTIGFWNEE